MLGPQFQQLQMLMKPSEMKAMPNFRFGEVSRDGDDVDVDILRQEKLHEAGQPTWEPENANGPSLARQLRNEGFKKPLDLTHSTKYGTTLADGHHRFFVGERWEDKGEEVYLPVRHRRSPWDA